MAIFTTPSGASVDESGKIISGPTGGGNGGGTGTGSNGSGTDDFLSQLQDKLMSSAGMVSSDNTQLEDSITQAISSVQKAGASSDTATGINFDRQIADQQTKNSNATTSFMEGSRGFAVNSAVLKQINDDNDKQIKDLEGRKQEALASGDATTAGKIADLQFQALTLRQNASQKAFENLISMGGFALNKDQADRAKETQTFQERQSIATIAMKYGLDIKPGETFESITQRAAPFASKEEKGQLDLQQAQIEEARANAAKSRADASKALTGSAGSFSPDTISLLAGVAGKNPSVLSLMDKDVATKVIAQMGKDSQPKTYAPQDMTTFIMEGKAANMTKNSVKAAIASNPGIVNKTDFLKAVDAIYGPDEPTQPFQAPGGPSSFVNAKPLAPASPEALAALQKALKGTAFGR